MRHKKTNLGSILVALWISYIAAAYLAFPIDWLLEHVYPPDPYIKHTTLTLELSQEFLFAPLSLPVIFLDTIKGTISIEGINPHQLVRVVMVLLSLCIGFFSVLSTLLFIEYSFIKKEKRQRQGLCQVCGYDLRASKDRCPECGSKFE